MESGVEAGLVEMFRVCSLVRGGLAEAPFRLEPYVLAGLYVGKVVRDPVFRATLPNVVKYLVSRRDAGARVLARIMRKSY